MAEQVKQEIHDRIAAVLQDIERETGVVVCSIAVDWVDVSTPEKSRHAATGINLETRKRAE